MRNTRNAVWITVLSVLALACSGRVPDAGPLPRQSADALPGPDRLVRDGVVFTPDVRIEGPPDEPVLLARARLRNVADTAVTLESGEDNCEPALHFVAAAGGRRFVWSHVVWQASRSQAPRRGVTCVGAGLIVTLPPRGQGELGRQTYPVRMLRGDSIPSGRYAVGVPAIVLSWPGGYLRADTVYVWARDVVLP